MGFEDEMEQSRPRPYRQGDVRSKLPHELTSSIVPRGTSFHCLVELEYPPIAFDPARPSCRCDFSGPLKFGAVYPDRCIITANRRASATIAFFIPRCLAIFIAHALSHDHFVETTSMGWAAS